MLMTELAMKTFTTTEHETQDGTSNTRNGRTSRYSKALVPRSFVKSAHEKLIKGLNSPILSAVPLRHFKSVIALVHGSHNSSSFTSTSDDSSTTLNSNDSQHKHKLQTKNIKVVTRNDLLNNTYDLDYPAAVISRRSTSPINSTTHRHKHHKHNRKSIKRNSNPLPMTENQLNTTHGSLESQNGIDVLDFESNEMYIPAKNQVKHLGENGEFLNIPLQKSFTRDSKLSDYQSFSTQLND